MTFSGAVLAGGRSSRFGIDKASYVYKGKPLALWVLESLNRANERFIVSNRFYDFGVPVYPDIYSGSSLAGLHAALTHATHDWVALAGCDLPFLTERYWNALFSNIEGVQVVVLTGPAGRREPLAAVYHKSLLPLAEARLRAGDLKLQAFVGEARARTMSWDQFGVDEQTLLNANRLGDLP